ncbi:MAG: transposase [Janthinobacterium lividum]
MAGSRLSPTWTWPKDRCAAWRIARSTASGARSGLKPWLSRSFSSSFATAGLHRLEQLYRRRWTIEQCFQNLKGRGFNLEASHLRCHQKLRKLVALVSLAYALCQSVD